MKYILSLILVLCFVVSKSQVLQEPNIYGYKFKRSGSDTLHFIPSDTLRIPTQYNGLSFIANKGGKLYYWNGVKWILFSEGSSYTFTNGITESGGTVKSGGIISEDTKFYIDNGYNINFDLDPGAESFSITNDGSDTAFIIRDHLNIFFPNIPTSSSITGRKVLVHDTATGKVERIDPSVLGGGTPITVTKAQVVSLMNSSSLVSGSIYKITGVQPGLYDDGTSSGTTIFLKALSSNLLSKKGWGEFYNPKYDHNITGFGVVDTSASYSVGDTVYWGQYVWVCNTGGMAVATDILNLDGNWTKLPYTNNKYNAVLDEIEYDFANDWIVSRKEADANNIISCSKSGNDILVDNFAISYPPISVFMWGNRYDFNAYKGVGGNAVLESYFECTNLYEGSIYSNTLSGSGIYSNTLSGSGIYSNTLSGSGIHSNTLSNSSIYSNTLNNYSSIYSNTLSGSGIHSNTLNNSYIYSNTLNNYSNIFYNTLNNSYIYSNTLNNYSSIYSNTLSGSGIYSNTLSNSGIYSNTLSSSNIFYNTLSSSNIYSNTLSSSGIYSNTLSSSVINANTLSSSRINVGLAYNLVSKNIRYIMGEYGNISVDITSATVVFGDYPKTLFRLPNGTFKLRYYDNSGVLVVANITD